MPRTTGNLQSVGEGLIDNDDIFDTLQGFSGIAGDVAKGINSFRRTATGVSDSVSVPVQPKPLLGVLPPGMGMPIIAVIVLVIGGVAWWFFKRR